MTIVPEQAGSAENTAGSVRVTVDRTARLLLGEGWSVRVLSSYAVRTGIELHSLADAIEFVCAHCLELCEATLVAILRRRLVCPSCYASPHVHEPRESRGIGGFRPCREEFATGKLYSFAR
ncbi:hypothetical protein ACFS2C_15300 [Prauserella oleivorans]|uniref:DUF433 domain-containing protein n=1 Tax=Prauserella oleivorans TaxID=1478153 RepID=A0ABW5W9W6_9PSEU